VNMFKESDKLWERLSKFEYNLEADVKKFDITVSFNARVYAYNIIYDICKRYGYNEQALKYLSCVLTDLLFTNFLLDGDLFSKPITPSGMLGTAELNCVIVALMYYYVFVRAKKQEKIPKALTFRSCVSPAFYGDDQSASVARIVAGILNNLTLSKAYSENGMTLTPSSKEGVMSPFISRDEVSFLKRQFRYSKHLNRWLAVLDVNSIYKMSSLSVRTNSVSELEHMVSVANSAIVEWYIWSLVSDFVSFQDIRNVYVSQLINTFHIDISDRILNEEKISDIISL